MDEAAKLDRLRQALPKEWAVKADAMDEDELRAEIVRAETRQREIASEQGSDEKLEEVQAGLKDIKGSYSATIKTQRAKITYCFHRLGELGKIREVEGWNGKLPTKQAVGRVRKLLPTGWQEEADAMDAESLVAQVVIAEQNIHRSEAAKGKDEKLAGWKAREKDLTDPYRKEASGEKAKVQWSLHLLEQMGRLEHVGAPEDEATGKE
jgi:hypothetical protein